MFFGSTHGASFNRSRARYHSVWTSDDFRGAADQPAGAAASGGGGGAFDGFAGHFGGAAGGGSDFRGSSFGGSGSPFFGASPFGGSPFGAASGGSASGGSAFQGEFGSSSSSGFKPHFTAHVPLHRTDALGLYAFLGLDQGPSTQQEDVARAYKGLARRLHPDKTHGTTEELFKTLKLVFDVLGDAETRARYDQFGLAAGFEGPVEPPPDAEAIRAMSELAKKSKEEAAATKPPPPPKPPSSREATPPLRPRKEGASDNAPKVTPDMPATPEKPPEKPSEKPPTPSPMGTPPLQPRDTKDAGTPPQAAEVAADSPLPMDGPDRAPDADRGAEACWSEEEGEEEPVRLRLPLTLAELVVGCVKVLRVPSRRAGTVEVTVPPGSRSGQTLRVRSVEVRLRRSDPQDTTWRRDGHDLFTTVMVPFGTVLYGGDVLLQHLDGRNLRVLMPSTSVLRRCLRDRTPLVVMNEGVRDAEGTGHLFVQCRFALPGESWFDAWTAAGGRDFDAAQRQPSPGMVWTDVAACQPPQFAAD